MDESDVLDRFVMVLMALIVVGVAFSIFLGNTLANDCTSRGGELLSSGECVTKGTKLSH